MADRNEKPRYDAENTGNLRRHIPEQGSPRIGADRSIRSDAPPYRWVCPCQEPPVLLATYDPAGKLNIKVRDRYWHLYGFGHVHAICPRCGGEHLLDLRQLQKQTSGADKADPLVS